MAQRFRGSSSLSTVRVLLRGLRASKSHRDHWRKPHEYMHYGKQKALSSLQKWSIIRIFFSSNLDPTFWFETTTRPHQTTVATTGMGAISKIGVKFSFWLNNYTVGAGKLFLEKYSLLFVH